MLLAALTALHLRRVRRGRLGGGRGRGRGRRGRGTFLRAGRGGRGIGGRRCGNRCFAHNFGFQLKGCFFATAYYECKRHANPTAPPKQTQTPVRQRTAKPSKYRLNGPNALWCNSCTICPACVQGARRSAPVPGRSNDQTFNPRDAFKRRRPHQAAAPEDGRAPPPEAPPYFFSVRPGASSSPYCLSLYCSARRLMPSAAAAAARLLVTCRSV